MRIRDERAPVAERYLHESLSDFVLLLKRRGGQTDSPPSLRLTCLPVPSATEGQVFRKTGNGWCTKWERDGTGEGRTAHRAGVWKGLAMIETVAVILIVLWLLGMVTSYTMGGVIHVLLVVAVIVVLIRVIQGRRVL